MSLSSKPKIMLFIPAYNCEKQISRVIQSLTEDVVKSFVEILVVENRSTDSTLEVAKEELRQIHGCITTLLQNNQNVSLGGSHKVAFMRCLEKGYDGLVVLHGDDQGDIQDAVPLLSTTNLEKYDCMLGSRFAKGAKLLGYSKFRTFGNILMNKAISVTTGFEVTDMGAGLNVYSSRFLSDKTWMNFPEDLTFNVYMLYWMLYRHVPYMFFPLKWKEEDQVSNAKLFKQTKHIIALTISFITNAKKLFATNRARFSEYGSQIVESRQD